MTTGKHNLMDDVPSRTRLKQRNNTHMFHNNVTFRLKATD